MKKRGSLSVIITLAAGILGAVLRVLQHKYSYDVNAGFDNPYHPYAIALIVLSVCFVLYLIIFVGPADGAKKGGYTEYFGIGRAGIAFTALAAAGMLAYGIMVGFLFTDVYNIATFIEPVLAFAGGASLLALMPSLYGRKSGFKLGTSFLTLWSAAYMVRHFFNFSKIPNVSSYLYIIFAIISIMFAFQYLNSFAIFSPKPGRCLFFMLCASYFNIVAYFSTLAIAYFERNEFMDAAKVLANHTPDYLPLIALTPMFLSLSASLIDGMGRKEEENEINVECKM